MKNRRESGAVVLRRKAKRHLLFVVLFACFVITPAQAAISMFGSWGMQATAEVPVVLFQDGADGIATITGGGTGCQVNITYVANWNWTSTSALYINNTDAAPHDVTIEYVSESGSISELDSMYCYINGTLFFSWYTGAAHTTSGVWNNLGAGERLVVEVTTLGDSSATLGHTFSIDFRLSYV